jgi:hypothetical protein
MYSLTATESGWWRRAGGKENITFANMRVGKVEEATVCIRIPSVINQTLDVIHTWPYAVSSTRMFDM